MRHSVYETAMKIDSLPDPLNLVYTETCSNIIEGSVNRSSEIAMKIDDLPDPLNLVYTETCLNVIEGSVTRSSKLQ